MKKKKVALFDVDKTIIKYDSMFLFLLFGIKEKPFKSYYLLKVILFSILYKLNIISAKKAKETYFYAINDMGEEDLKRFYKKYLERCIYKQALHEMKTKKEEDYFILLVSASPEAYLKFFKSIPYVDAIIGTKLKKLKNGYVNIIEGENCKGDEKCKRIEQFLQKRNLEIDYEASYAYSDSTSDWPMLKLVKNRFFINRKAEGVKTLYWN